MALLVIGLLVELPLAVWVITDRGHSTKSEASSIGTAALHPLAGRFTPDATRLADCSTQTCFEQAFGNVAYQRGPKVALELVARKYAAGADPSCHRVVHMIGAASLARFEGDVARTFAAGSSLCWSGYYHGVLERAFLGVKAFDAKTLGAKARSLCRGVHVQKESWLAYQCLHGLGHGLMITTGYQLPLALEVCRELATPWDQTSCKGGVFMENVLTSYGGESPWVRQDDPVYPCDVVGEGDKYMCYQQVTTRMIRLFGTDWTKLAALCARVERLWRATCFGSFGQSASVNSDREPARTAKICAIARPYGGEASCVRYAAEDIAGTYSNGIRAATLCDSTVGGVREQCYEAIGSLLRYLKPTTAARTAACSATTHDVRSVAACLRGTRRTASIPGLTRN
jgi:hypothetical protein